ncbi:MAG: class I SAM-dependent methyltransferase [Candidatus Omnitrophica bacterium]|nr:class I SAM-dependent methyltransferase [Candidatus Omnitrophota bacterium]
MGRENVFDMPHYQALNSARKKFLEDELKGLFESERLKTAIDVGCGTGYFSNYLEGLGLRVTGIDWREQNAAEAGHRYPKIEFRVGNVEDTGIRRLGRFDLVLCFGLLYHLENPFQAVRNLQELTAKILLIESMIVPGARPEAVLRSEPLADDQGMHYIAFLPSEACLVKMLYLSGFPHVYKPITMPDHKDFRQTISCHRRRTILAAARRPIEIPIFKSVPEPNTHHNPWEKAGFLHARDPRRIS